MANQSVGNTAKVERMRDHMMKLCYMMAAVSDQVEVDCRQVDPEPFSKSKSGASCHCISILHSSILRRPNIYQVHFRMCHQEFVHQFFRRLLCLPRICQRPESEVLVVLVCVGIPVVRRSILMIDSCSDWYASHFRQHFSTLVMRAPLFGSEFGYLEKLW
ncbi:hypothetical protein BDN67DRAFT_94941 [Paxillus ammoniavirescens]|nr:hypothetical protein BDN67DRAFT_94941 [Paxillus ammoniavirescens]